LNSSGGLGGLHIHADVKAASLCGKRRKHLCEWLKVVRLPGSECTPVIPKLWLKMGVSPPLQ